MKNQVSHRSFIPKSGFTIYELLAVIAVLLILAALLLPVFQSVKAAAHKTACISNLKQLCQASYLYIKDNDDFYPRGVHEVNSPNGAITIGDPSIPTLKNLYDDLNVYMSHDLQIALCPSDGNPINWGGIIQPFFLPFRADELGSYSPNYSVFTEPYLCCDTNGLPVHQDIGARNESQLQELPADTTLFYDTKYVTAGNENLDGPLNCEPYSSGYQYRTPNIPFGIGSFPGAKRHLAGLCVAFVDLHAAWLKGSEQLFKLTAPEANYQDECNPGDPFYVYRFPFDFNGIPGTETDP